jgi:hypothetical protein
MDTTTRQAEIDSKHVTLHVWDTAEQERFRALGASVYRSAQLSTTLHPSRHLPRSASGTQCGFVFKVSHPIAHTRPGDWSISLDEDLFSFSFLDIARNVTRASLPKQCCCQIQLSLSPLTVGVRVRRRGCFSRRSINRTEWKPPIALWERECGVDVPAKASSRDDAEVACVGGESSLNGLNRAGAGSGAGVWNGAGT